MDLALAALKKGQPESAESLLQRVIQMSPDNFQAHFALGASKAAEGDLKSAISHLREALRYAPRFQPAIVRLAMLYMQTGEFQQAEKYALRGLLAEPNEDLCTKILGQCRLNRGDYSGALSSFDSVVKERPGDAQAHFARATILRKLHRPQEAVAAFKAAAKTSSDIAVHLQLAETQADLGQMDACVESCRKALSADPGSYQANLLLARALTNLDRLSDAEEYWQRAEFCERSVGETRAVKAMLYAQVGIFVGAEEAALQAIELNPRHGRPYHVLFSCRRATPADQPMIDQIEQVLADPAGSEEDKVDLFYALGKAYDNLGESERAIGAFDNANARKRYLLFGNQAFDRDLLSRSVDAQIEMMTPEALSQTDGPNSQLPIFALGLPRTGTTLVDQILSNHPSVGSAGEQGFWLDYEKTVVDYETKSVDAAIAEVLRAQYTDLLSGLAPGFKHVLDKNPANLMVAGLLHIIFPASRIICTKRHAVDTAMSIWMTQMQTTAPFICDRSNIVFATKQCLRLMDHWRNVMPRDRYTEVQYEELTEEPEEHAKTLLRFCGLEWNEACLHPESNRRKITTPSFWQARQPIYRTSVDRWKKYERWLGPFEELIGL